MKRRVGGVVTAIVMLVLVLGLCGLLFLFNDLRSKGMAAYFANMQPPTVTISATTLAPGNWNPTVNAVGTIEAENGVDIAPQVGGIVKEIRFKANDTIAAGQVVLQIDDAVETADLAAAQTAVTLSEQALDRARTLGQRGVVSTSSIDTAEGNLATARSTLAKIKATIELKAVKAPFGGTIGIPKVDVGQFIAAGTAIATLQNLSRMKVNFTIPEQELGKLSVGQKLHVSLNDGGKSYAGTIIGIDPKIDPATRLVSVQGLVDNSEQGLVPGQFVKVAVELPQETNIIVVPQTAVVPSLYGDYVFVVEPRQPPANAPAPAAGAPPPATLQVKQVFVKSGRRNDSSIEIVSGLKAGDRVVTSGQNKLNTGTPVAVDNTVDPAKAGPT
jgi:membrane fusion protein (multidrug efflux system)